MAFGGARRFYLSNPVSENSKLKSAALPRGVLQMKNGKWQARYSSLSKQFGRVSLGVFESEEAAARAYDAAVIETDAKREALNMPRVKVVLNFPLESHRVAKHSTAAPQPGPAAAVKEVEDKKDVETEKKVEAKKEEEEKREDKEGRAAASG